MTVSVTQKVKESCAAVAAQAQHVRINMDAVPAYTDFILKNYTRISGHTDDHHVTEDVEKTAAYFLALNSINCGSGFFEALGVEYTDIAGSLTAAFKADRLSAPAQWAVVTAEELAQVLAFARRSRMRKVAGREAEGHAEGEAVTLLHSLLNLFASHLNATGKILMAQYEGSAVKLLEAADYSAEKLVNIVTAWPNFRDTAMYGDTEVHFHKRAQLMTSHLNLTGVIKMKDMDAVTVFPDNMIPHVLRHDGVLSYSDTLLHRINAGHPLESGSPEEIEIRACAVHAGELMRRRALESGHTDITAADLDHLLWNRGYEAEIYKHPSHKTLAGNY